MEQVGSKVGYSTEILKEQRGAFQEMSRQVAFTVFKHSNPPPCYTSLFLSEAPLHGPEGEG